MPTRRKILEHVAATAVLTATTLPFAKAAGAVSRPVVRSRANTGSPSGRIRSLSARDETLIRYGGAGGPGMFTWAADDRQIGCSLDGPGYPELPKDHYRSSTLLAISGADPHHITFGNDFPTYIDTALWKEANFFQPVYYGFSTLAVENTLYQFMSTRHIDPPPTLAHCKTVLNCVTWPWNGAKLIYSPDNGRTWCNQNGSTPVVADKFENQTRDTMAFLEPDYAFTYPIFLQMGKAYRDNKDGYVYVYGNSGHTDGTMNQVVMFRVPKNSVTNRGAYEYFTGRLADGSATWDKDIKARKPILTFPRGYVSSRPICWQPEVHYIAPLNSYIMSSSADPTEWWIPTAPQLPTYFGVWVSDQPWGPWRLIHEETGRRGEKVLPGMNILPKWIAPDGKSFWVIFNLHTTEKFIDLSEREMSDWTTEVHTEEESWRGNTRFRMYHPNMAFCFQRIDLDVA